MSVSSDSGISRQERFRRVELMLGSEALDRLENSSVTLVGLGAVGSYALEGLVRGGVGKLRIIDFDRVAPSNINRQLLALESTVGRRKCDVALERALDINPACEIEAIGEFVDGQNVADLIGAPDLVIDAIDALNPKVNMVIAVRERGLPLISCLGAALRFDPTQVRVGELSEVHYCPLGKAVRTRLRRRGVPTDFQCVYSDEPLPNPLPLAAPTERLGEQPAIQRGRVRNTLGSMPTVTGVFGLTAANLAIKMLIGR